MYCGKNQIGFDVKNYLHIYSRKLFLGEAYIKKYSTTQYRFCCINLTFMEKWILKSEFQENTKMSRKLMKFLIMFDNSNLLFFPGQFLTGRVILEVDDDMPVLGKFSFWFKDNRHFISTSYRPQYLHLKSKSTKLKILTVNSISDVCPNRVVNQCH